MIDRKKLLDDCKGLMRKIEADLIARSGDTATIPEVVARLEAEYEKAREASRTALNFEDWRADYATQQAAAWILSAVFVRFLEDNRLIDPPRIAGPGDRLQYARDQHELYTRQHPTLTDRDYLLQVFHDLGTIPGGREIFGKYNPVFELPQWLGPDMAIALRDFFQKVDGNARDVVLVHDFTDPAWDTRFLGDLYQDLSEAARKKYALLQTPEFVEEFILHRTLDPALDEFGLDASALTNAEGDAISGRGFRMIDPACGSGHFLLGAFRRILDRWTRQAPRALRAELVQRALDSVHGVDLNPYAIAIARFRLLIAALKECGVHRLKDAPAFHFKLAAGDALLHGSVGGDQQLLGFDPLAHHYESEDIDLLRKILRPGTYHAVVANPPYITPKDKALAVKYREHYSTCHRQYSLSVPFMERIYNLATEKGLTGQITANSFMKREFGKKLIEEFIPTIDLTHIIDTSGAYIPGHGTPTVILFGRRCAPFASTIRTVMGIRGEPSTPAVPASGLVWSAIVAQIDAPGSESDFVTVSNSLRDAFHSHPWTIGGGGAAELKEQVDAFTEKALGPLTTAIGRGMHTACDESYFADTNTWKRFGIGLNIPLVEGDIIRDWTVLPQTETIFPYTERLVPIEDLATSPVIRSLWLTKQFLVRRREPNGTHEEIGLTWYEWSRFQRERFRTPLSIVYAEVATHNHFVLDRGGKVFKQTAPVIKLPAGASEDEHLALLGLLNSSTACFWMKQVCHQKQMMGGDGIRIESKAKVPFAFNATALKKLPIPEGWQKGPHRDRLLELTRLLDKAAAEYAETSASAVIEAGEMRAPELRERWHSAQKRRALVRSKQVLVQEEIDFLVYTMFGLIDDNRLLSERTDWNVSGFTEGMRPFCMYLGENEDGFEVPDSVPDDCPPDLKELWQARIEAIQENERIRLIEAASYKRRWIGRQGLFNHLRSDDELADALRSWLLARLEGYFDFDGRMRPAEAAGPVHGWEGKLKPGIHSIGAVAEVARQDPAFMEAAQVYTDDPAFDVTKLVEALMLPESVPLLPVLRYKDSGLRKRAEWEKTWALQREEDALARQRKAAESALAETRAAVEAGLAGEKAAVAALRRELAEQRAALRRGEDKTDRTDRTDRSDKGDEEELAALGERVAAAEGAYEAALQQRLKEDPAYTAAQAARKAIPPNPRIAVPPKYTSADFKQTHHWRLRGKLDVPKERWVSLPHCEGPGGLPVVAWAGLNHLQLTKAISEWFVKIQEELGGSEDPRLVPLLAGVLELLPWLKQWHNDIDPEFQLPMGDYFESFVHEEAQKLGMTQDELRAWQPPARAKAKTKAKRKSKTGGR
jgi:hypothetical protein